MAAGPRPGRALALAGPLAVLATLLAPILPFLLPGGPGEPLPAAVAGPLAAQEGATALHLWGGIPHPGEDLSRIVDSGWEIGVGVEHRLTDRLGVLALGGRSYLDEAVPDQASAGPERGPPVVFWHYTLGLVLELTEPPGPRSSGNPWEVSINAGVGGGTWDVKLSEADPEFLEEGGLGGNAVASDTRPAATAGIQVGPDLTDFANLFFRSQVYLVFGDAGNPNAFLGKETLYTQTFGFRLRF